MTIFVALLRAINVGGTGKLAMGELRSLCEEAGFRKVRTYIQSGNLVFESALAAHKVQSTLERLLANKMGKPMGVHVRSASELAQVLARNPFKKQPPSKVVVMFLDEAPGREEIDSVAIPDREQLEVHGRELFVYYPDGQGRSKLKVPFARTATGRNVNTLTRLAEMAGS